ncbi:GPW/gp25 family protein [Arthrobacter sp. LAPM80]|uniref:GPW/gp25 family protein n=1 Tax=Arthrobacter sp. LAPM80 TaxID=3141788 RepID=UPI00398B6ED6
MNIEYPWRFDDHGLTATIDDAGHVRDMIEEFLFTNPGERVNRPDFGSGLAQLVFGPNSPELAAALQFTVRAGLQRWLGDVMAVTALAVTADDSTISVDISYRLAGSPDVLSETFTGMGEP